MGVHSSRFAVAVTNEDDAVGSPLLSASLCWRRGGQPRTAPAVILLVRGDRLLLLADRSPACGGLAVVRLGWPLPTGWATGVVSQTRRTRLGPWEIELVLAGRPSATFRMLRHGNPERH